ncbi:MAG TPA: hypothetical protein DCL48_13345 [Alphaproteobacteria bacterium]|nr:hypothetical protein [Alphaproteobacteria bacterium]
MISALFAMVNVTKRNTNETKRNKKPQEFASPLAQFRDFWASKARYHCVFFFGAQPLKAEPT